MLPEQLAYILAWVDGVISGGYRAGIYCSGIPFQESSNVSVVTAKDIREHAGRRAIHFFVSNDQCPPAPGCVFPKAPPSPAIVECNLPMLGSSAIAAASGDNGGLPTNLRKDGNCYPPGCPASGIHVDVDTANSADPSHARTR